MYQNRVLDAVFGTVIGPKPLWAERSVVKARCPLQRLALYYRKCTTQRSSPASQQAIREGYVKTFHHKTNNRCAAHHAAAPSAGPANRQASVAARAMRRSASQYSTSAVNQLA
jgi:hypothetical protein